MSLRLPRPDPTSATWIATAVSALLAPRFLVDVAIAASAPPAEVRTAVAQFFAAYELVLPFALLPVVLLLAGAGPRRPAFAAALGFLAVQAVVLALGTATLLAYGSAETRALFPPFAVAGVAGGSVLALAVHGEVPGLLTRWRGGAFLALLAIVPAALAMRAAAPLGVGTAPGQGGALQGNWLLVNLPTLLLELLAVGVWLNLLLGSRPADLRRRWWAFLPFLAVPVSAAAFIAGPLSGFILSATISWGANLAVFVPPEVSLTLAVASLACWASAFLLVPRAGRRDPWNLLLLGTLVLLLAGLRPTAGSVEALNLGLVLAAVGLSRWPRAAS